MKHNHNFSQFEHIFRDLLEGVYSIDDIHEMYIYYKENVVFECAYDFLNDWFEGLTIDNFCMYLKTTEQFSN